MYIPNIHGNLNYNLTKGVQRYVQDASGRDVYIKRGNHEIYAFDFNKKRENFAVDKNKNEFYCKRDNNEVYALSLNSGFERFAIIGGSLQIYALTKFGDEKYPLNLYRKEKMARRNVKTQPEYYYAKLANRDEFYLRDDLKQEYVYVDNGIPLIAMTKDGLPKAPLSRNGTVKYNTDGGDIEILYDHLGEPFFGKDMAGNEIYPKKLTTKEEYYPVHNSNLLVAKFACGTKRYAVSDKKKIIYPKRNGVSFYIIDDNGDTHSSLKKQANRFEQYVSPEKYPIKNTQFGVTEVIINDIYLQRYPLDSNLNEYTNSKGDIIESQQYPITNDDYIILPNIKNKPFLKPGDQDLLNHVKYLLYRPEFDSYDFLTNVKSKRHSVASHHLPYEVLDLSNYKIGTFNIDYYIFGYLFAVIIFLLLCILI